MCVYMYIRHSLFLAWPYKLHGDLMWFLFLFGTQNGREMWWAHVLTFPLKDLHPYDIHLFWADVRERVKQQVFAESSCPAAGTTLSKIDVSSLRLVVRVGTWSVSYVSSIPVHGLTQIKSLCFENHSLSSPGHILPLSIEVNGKSRTETHKVKNVMCPCRHSSCTENAIDWTG
jgi:hypothetical protein